VSHLLAEYTSRKKYIQFITIQLTKNKAAESLLFVPDQLSEARGG